MLEPVLDVSGQRPAREQKQEGRHLRHLKIPVGCFLLWLPRGVCSRVTGNKDLGISGTDTRWAGSRTSPTYPVLLYHPDAVLVTPTQAGVLLLLSIKFLKSC